ncbi:MAG: flagellar hook-associated protein FlgK [Fimbriimonadaceae bacterium]|nr:flagellar hook-associated protein FlgK [Fimbriimonadaceae bacterium]
MPSPFNSINIASKALSAFQRGLDVVGHNIANVGTKGYNRQIVSYGATNPSQFWSMRALSLGTGVAISSIARAHDGFVQKRFQGVQAELGRFSTLSTALSQVEAIYNEPGANGIAAALDRFFNSWSSLSANPGTPAAQLEVQQSGIELARRIRRAFEEVVATEKALEGQITATMGEIDKITTRIDTLNKEITAASATGAIPNDLLDQRDLAIEELSRITDIQTYSQPDGSISVYAGALTLVDRGGARPYPQTFDAATYTVSDGLNSYAVPTGTLFGSMEALNRMAANRASLDSLADGLRDGVNALYRTATNSYGETDLPFFNETAIPPTTGAGDFDLAANLKSDASRIGHGTSGAPGDGALAQAIAALREQPMTGLGGSTYHDFYSGVLVDLARSIESANTSRGTQEALAIQIDQQRQAISGVSLDEEMAEMLRLQRSYQAAAKALSIFDQVTEDLLTMLR